MQLGWHDVIGNCGVALIVGIYFALQLGRAAPDSLSYSLINGLGALLILISLSVDFNLSAAAMEIFWLLISGFGVLLWLRRKRAQLSGAET